MADRESKLRLLVQLVGADKAASAVQLLGDSIDLIEINATGAAAALQVTAAAVDQVADAEADATDESRRTAAALESVGVAAAQTGQEIVSTATQSAEAIADVTASAQAEALALEEAGRAGVDSGREVEAAADLAAGSIAKLTQEWKESADGAKAAGLAFDADTVVDGVRELAAGIRTSNDALQTQKDALLGIADQLVEDLDSIKSASTGAGDETTAQAKLIGDALADVRGKIAEVDQGLRAVGDAGTEGGAEASGGVFSVARALELANAASDKATTSLEETGRLPAKELANLSAVIETVNIALERTASTSGAATAEQLANVDALKTRLGELTEVTNRQTNASKDNAVGLKESGNQVNDLTGAITGLLGVTGNTGTVYGSFIQKIGQSASAYERAKDAVASLNINQLGAAKGAAGLGLQLTAIIGTAIAAAAAGLKLASVNKENADAMKGAADAAKDLIPTQAGLRDGWDGVQHALQNVLVDLDQFVRISNGTTDSSAALTDRTRDLMGVTEGYDKRVVDLASSLDQLGVSLRSGRSGADLYAIGLRDGLSETEAFKLGVQDAADVLKFYRDAQAAGAPGQELWNQAMRESGNTAAGVTASVRDLIPTMNELLGVQGKLPPALQKEFDARQKLVAQLEASRRAYDAETAAKQSASDATQANVRTLIEENAVTEGSTEAINRRAAAIAEHILQSDVWSVSLGRTASALQETLNQTDGLTAAERARIQELIALTERANELTGAERVYAEQLAKSIQNGNTAVAASKELGAAKEALAATTRALTESERLEQASTEASNQAITDRIEFVRQLIDEEERRLGIGQEQTDDNFLAGASLEFLRQKEAQLLREKEEGLTIVRSSTAAKGEESTAREELSAIIEREKAAAVGATGAHTDLHAVLENGRTVYTNLTDAQRTNADEGIKVAESQKKIKASADEAMVTMQKLGGDVVPLVTSSFDALLSKGADLEKMFERVNEKIREMNKSAEEAAAS